MSAAPQVVGAEAALALAAEGKEPLARVATEFSPEPLLIVRTRPEEASLQRQVPVAWPTSHGPSEASKYGFVLISMGSARPPRQVEYSHHRARDKGCVNKLEVGRRGKARPMSQEYSRVTGVPRRFGIIEFARVACVDLVGRRH